MARSLVRQAGPPPCTRRTESTTRLAPVRTGCGSSATVPSTTTAPRPTRRGSSAARSVATRRPATAARIIAYRQAHPFRTVEELRQVDGIGERRFAQLKDLVTVG